MDAQADKREYFIRIKSCNRIPQKFKDDSMAIFVDGNSFSWTSEVQRPTDGSITFREGGSRSFIYTLPVKTNKTNITFKLMELNPNRMKKGQQKPKDVHSWKVNLSAFIDRVQIINVSLSTSNADPVLVINVLDLITTRARDPSLATACISETAIDISPPSAEPKEQQITKYNAITSSRGDKDKVDKAEKTKKRLSWGKKTANNVAQKSDDVLVSSVALSQIAKAPTVEDAARARTFAGLGLSSPRALRLSGSRRKKRDISNNNTSRDNNAPSSDYSQTEESGAPSEEITEDDLTDKKELPEEEHEDPEQYEGLKDANFSYANVESDDTLCDVSHKVIIIGDSGCGKTCVLSRWMANTFSFLLPHTVNVDIGTKTFKLPNSSGGKVIQFQFWDTAGQERFSAMSRSYYTGAHGAVIVYSITDRESFRNIPRWLEAFKMICPNVEIILIGNKNDLVDQRKVSVEEGMELARQNGIAFLETSAKNGANCLKAMQILLEEIHQKATREELEQEARQERQSQSSVGNSSVIKIDNRDVEDQTPEDNSCCGWSSDTTTTTTTS